MSTHHGLPIGTAPPADAKPAELAAWYREEQEPLPAKIESHLDLWLTRHSLECEVIACRKRWKAATSDSERRKLSAFVAGIQAKIDELTADMELIRRDASRAA